MSVESIITQNKDKWLKSLEDMREMILSNLVMVSQIPAPTFKEEKRAAFIRDRFIEVGLEDPYIDDCNNVIGILKTKNPKKTILLCAHMDNIFNESEDHNVKVDIKTAQGAGVADNSMGVAALLSLPDIMRQLKIELDTDIVFLAAARSVGRGDLEGIRYFLKNWNKKIDFCIGLEGVQLGRLDYFSLSNVRGDIKIDLNVEEAEVWGELGYTSAILVLNDLINNILEIRIPQRPKTFLNLGLLSGGESYDKLSSTASLSFEIRSEANEIVDGLIETIKGLCEEIVRKYNYNIDIKANFFGRQHAGGLRFSHSLVKSAVMILEELGYIPKLGASNGDITVPLSLNIPSVTLGITTGKKSALPNGLVLLEPVSKGILQILLLLCAIDKELDNGTQ